MLDKLIVQADQNIGQAMRVVNKNECGICFVVESRKLIGVASDGDLRRSLLSGSSLETNIKIAMNSNYVALPFNSSDKKIYEKFKDNLKLIPLCDENGNLVDYADVKRTHRIPIINPDFSGREFEYVKDCFLKNWISSQGGYVRKFEEKFELMYPGMSALAVSNGTVSLHLALSALGIGKGDEVIVPNITFAATANAVIYCNAVPVLCEVDSKSMCIDIKEAEKLITNKTKAIMPVHLYGRPCNIDTLYIFAKKHKILVIEDCAESIGSSWKGKYVGTYSDAATFSFYGNKTISTGEGGMVIFRDESIAKFARILRDHGMNPSKKYWHDHIGFNYRLTNIQAAIGVGQMERFEEIIEKKKTIALSYTKKLQNVQEITLLPEFSPNFINSNWLYTILLDLKIKRDLVIEALLKRGIDTRPVFYPLHLMLPYKKFKKSKKLENSILISQTGISLPTSINLKKNEIDYICQNLISILKNQI